ncbi:unnamed protein product [Closterium sp. NIES-64]|nr:unnamed protein product [Closterium sp. NIES-64]
MGRCPAARSPLRPLTPRQRRCRCLPKSVSLLLRTSKTSASLPSPSNPCPPLVADLRGLTSVSAFGDEGSRGTPPSAPAKCIAGGRRDERRIDVGLQSTGEEQVEEQQPTREQAAVKPTTEQSVTGPSAGEPTTGEKSAGKPITVEQLAGTPAEEQQDAEGSDDSSDDGGDAEGAQPGPRRSGRLRRPPDFFVPLPSPRTGGVLMTKYHIDDTVEREKARLVVKGFTQVYGADYDETFAPVSSYVTLRIFLSIVAVLNLNLM